MRKYVLLFITIIIALMLCVSGCSNTTPAIQPLSTPSETAASPEPTSDPLAEYPVVGPWGLSVSKNNMADLYTVFGTSLRDYGAGMEIKSDGSIDCYVGATGGAGNYTRDGAKITASLISYNEGVQTTLELQLSQDGNTVIMSGSIYDTTLYWTQDEADMAKVSTNDNAVYDPVLEKYRDALNNQLDDLALSEAGLSYMLMFHYVGEPLENMGYCFVDLDGDGSDELLIAQLSGDEFFDKLIYDMYTLIDGSPKLVLSSGERDRYYLTDNNMVYNSGSSSAMESVYRELCLVNGELITSRELSYNGSSDTGMPWSLSYEGISSSISEEQAQNTIAEMESTIVKPEYTPFSMF